jgi:hypothetical protein
MRLIILKTPKGVSKPPQLVPLATPRSLTMWLFEYMSREETRVNQRLRQFLRFPCQPLHQCIVSAVSTYTGNRPAWPNSPRE